MSWKLIFKHNFSPHIIWNNQYYQPVNHFSFLIGLIRALFFVSDLVNNRGDFYSYEDVIELYGLNVSKQNYIKLTKTI